MITFNCELTDTFGDQANYSWVERHQFQISENATRLQIVRHAKRLLGLTGTRCRTTDLGDLIELKPQGLNLVAFISIEY